MHHENYGTYTCEARLKNFPVVSTSIKIVKPGPPIIEAVYTQFGSSGSDAIIEALTEAEPQANVRLNH